MQGLTTKVIKGSAWTLAGQIVPLAVSVVATPFVIRLLGAEQYGLLILVGLFPTYLSFAGFGMSTASTRFSAERYAASDDQGEAALLRTAALIALAGSLPFAAVVFVFSSSLVGFLNVPAELLYEGSLALKITAVSFLLGVQCEVFNSPQLVRLRMDLNSLIGAGNRIFGLTVTPIILYLGGGVLEAVVVLLVGNALALTSHVVVSTRLLRELRGWSISRSAYRPLIRFGFGLVLTGIASVLLFNVEKVVLTKLTSVEMLAYYSVAYTLARMMTLFSASLSQSLVPAFSQLQAEDQNQRLSGLYSRGIRLNLILLTPGVAALMIFATPLLTLWAGEKFGIESTLPFYILLFGIVMQIIGTPAKSAIIARGRSDLMAKVAWIELVPFIVTVLIATYHFGIVGAAIAWSLRAGIDGAIALWLAGSVCDLTFISTGRMNIAFGVSIMAAPAVIHFVFNTGHLLSGTLLLISLLVYCYFVWKRLITNDEATWIASKIAARTIGGHAGSGE